MKRKRVASRRMSVVEDNIEEGAVDV
jgi:hypothetical protein